MVAGRAAVADRLRLGNEAHRLRALVRAVQVEDVVGRRLDALVLLDQQQSLEDVDELGDVRHVQLVGVVVEHVQRQRRHAGVADRVLLVQPAARLAGLDRVPCAPLVQDQLDLALRVELVHDRPVAGDDALDGGGLGQQFQPLRLGVFGRRARRAAVVVGREALHHARAGVPAVSKKRRVQCQSAPLGPQAMASRGAPG